MLRFLSAGESHGKALTAIIDGLPAGIPLVKEDINKELARRQQGYGRGPRQKIEKDQVDFLSGVRHGSTLGSPITLVVHNRDWQNWEVIMASRPLEEGEAFEKVQRPRPGHADLSGMIKYGFDDARNVLERTSARETAIRVAVGAIAKRVLELLDIHIISYVVNIGGLEARKPSYSSHSLETSQLNCFDSEAEKEMIKKIDDALEQGDTLGGIFEIMVSNLPIGLGAYSQWDRKLDARLAQALMSIQGIKGVEFGLGFEVANLPGSQVHDEIYYSIEQGFYRNTNGAGGIEGGMSNGEPLIIRGAMKPIPTLRKPLNSVNFVTKEEEKAAYERSDVCAVPAASVIGEMVIAWELLRAVLEKFSGDTWQEVLESLNQYRKKIRQV